MKFKELVELAKERINKDDKWIDFRPICEDLNLDYTVSENIDYDKNHKLRSVYIMDWMCTDTIVGTSVIFFDEKPAALIYQEARKSDPVVKAWFSEEIAKEVREYILSIVEKNDEYSVDILDEEDMNTDMKNGYKISYTGELMAKQVFYKNKLCDVVSKPKTNIEGGYNFHDLIIKDGKEEIRVDIREVEIPYPGVNYVND